MFFHLVKIITFFVLIKVPIWIFILKKRDETNLVVDRDKPMTSEYGTLDWV